MTSFRRFVIVIAEAMQVLSMVICTLLGGIFGAASGAFRSAIFVSSSNINIDGVGQVASTGAVIGVCIGAIAGFVVSSTVASIVFCFVQIERNTRGPLENASSFPALSEPHQSTPRFR